MIRANSSRSKNKGYWKNRFLESLQNNQTGGFRAAVFISASKNPGTCPGSGWLLQWPSRTGGRSGLSYTAIRSSLRRVKSGVRLSSPSYSNVAKASPTELTTTITGSCNNEVLTQNTCQPYDSIRFNALIWWWLSNPETFQIVRFLSLRLSCCVMSVQYFPMKFVYSW